MEVTNLASEALGARVLEASDDFFAPKENLLKRQAPVWDAYRYTDRGKWMDGWETRRRRDDGHDWVTVELGIPGLVREAVVDTTHFKGNAPESCSVEGTLIEGSDPVGQAIWTELLPKTPIESNAPNVLALPATYCSHVRLHIYPDGGVARFRLVGEPVCVWPKVMDAGDPDVASLPNGGAVVACSDAFFGAPEHLLYPTPPAGMWDGWETRRRRGPGHDWVVVRLGGQAAVRAIEVDTRHFKGNFPESCSLDASTDGEGWVELVPRTQLAGDAGKTIPASQPGPFDWVRLNTYPDGGVARLRIFGAWTTGGRQTLALRYLNALPAGRAQAAFASVTAASAWVESMLAARPYDSWEALTAAAAEVWDGLGPESWRQSIDAHPRLGERQGRPTQAPRARRWSQAEQSGLKTAEPQLLDRLAAANRAYEERFGHTFVTCATGKSAETMLAELEVRLARLPADELATAAAEEKKILMLRLEKWVTP